MHKSAITLSLFLLVALIMLVPFTSINFSNVKAQEYGIYDNDDKDIEEYNKEADEQHDDED